MPSNVTLGRPVGWELTHLQVFRVQKQGAGPHDAGQLHPSRLPVPSAVREGTYTVFWGPGPSQPFHRCVHHVVSETVAVGLGAPVPSWPRAPGVQGAESGSGDRVLSRWRHPTPPTEPQRGRPSSSVERSCFGDGFAGVQWDKMMARLCVRIRIKPILSWFFTK